MIDLNTTSLDLVKVNTDKYKNLDAKNAEDARLRQVSNEFESFFLKQLLDISLKSTNISGKGAGSDIIKGMYTETLSRNSAGTMGISDMLYKYLSEQK
jgi:Rod binding domain-containing protein